MEYRKAKWLDIKTRRTVFGIEGQKNKGDRFLPCCEGNKPLLFDCEIEMNLKLSELRKKERTNDARRIR